MDVLYAFIKSQELRALIEPTSQRPDAATAKFILPDYRVTKKYWQSFYDMQSFDECQGKCLVVKLGAEISDLSESMRLALVEGTKGIVARIERMIRDGLADGSVSIYAGPHDLALDLYTGWIGASVLAKINRGPESLDRVMAMTLQRLHIA